MMSAGKFRLSSGTFSFIGIAFHASNELTTVGLAMILTLFSSGRVCLFNSYLPFRHQTRGAGGSWGSKSASCVQIKVETLRTKGISLRCYASNSKALSTQTPARRNIIDILVDVSAIELWDILTDRNLTFFYELHLALRSEDFKAVCSDQSQSGTRKVVDIQLSYTTPLPLAGLRANNTEKIEARWRDSEFQEWVMESTASTSNVPFSSLFINRVYWQVKSSGHGKARLRIQAETIFLGPVLPIMQRTLETESFKGIKEAYTVLPSVINRILKLKKGQNGTFVRNNRHSSRMNVPKDALHVDGAINKSLARNLPKLQPTSFQQIVKQVGARYPDWTSTRYGGGNAANGKCPTPKEAVAILKAITQARHSVFQWQSSLPREPLVRGLLRSIQTETGCIADDLPSSLVPDVIRCLGTIGRDSYFESEMDTLCSLIPRVEFVSTQQVHSVLRGLCLSRHWTTHLPQLELSVIKLLTDEPQSVSPRSIRYAAHCCQGLVFLGHTPSGLFRLLETMYDDEQLFSWEASISLAWSLAIGGNDSIHRALVGKLLEGILRHAESLPDYINSRLSMLGQFFLTIDILRPGLLESHYRRKGGEALAEIVTKALHTYKSTSIRQISTAQREVYDCFLRMGFHKAQLETAIDGISLDIILQEPIQLAVEVNGITHFARNAVDLPVGNAEWKARLLHAMHWKLISIKVDQWNQLRGPENRAKFLADAIRS